MYLVSRSVTTNIELYVTPINASFDNNSLTIKSKIIFFQAPVNTLNNYINLYNLYLTTLFL
jgi:hypothetical protein